MFWISKFKNGDVNNIVYQKEVIDIFVNFVYLDEDKLVIGFNYKDGTKTLLLSELEGEPSSWVLSSYLEQCSPPQFVRKPLQMQRFSALFGFVFGCKSVIISINRRFEK